MLGIFITITVALIILGVVIWQFERRLGKVEKILEETKKTQRNGGK